MLALLHIRKKQKNNTITHPILTRTILNLKTNGRRNIQLADLARSKRCGESRKRRRLYVTADNTTVPYTFNNYTAIELSLDST